MATSSIEDGTGDTPAVVTPTMDTTQSELKLENVENFRQIPNTKLFRSARPDEASANDVKTLFYLDIKCIIDCRDPAEMLKQDNPPLLDDYYSVYRYRKGQFNQISSPARKDLASGSSNKDSSQDTDDNNTHYMIPIAHCSPYYWELFKRAAPDIKCKILYYAVYDKVYNTRITSTIGTQHIVSHGGLIGLYRDMIEFCSTTLCAGQ